MGILSTDFMNALPNDIEIFACVGRKDVLVPHASAQHLSRKNYLNVEDANHKTICRPSSKEATNYSRLLIMMDLTMISNPVFQTHAYLVHQQHHEQDFIAPLAIPLVAPLAAPQIPRQSLSSEVSNKTLSANLPFCNISMASLCQELNRIRTRIGIDELPMIVESTLPLNELFEEHHQQNPRMIMVTSRLLSSASPNQKLEFLFRDAKSMAQVVGIGMSYAVATVSQSLAVEVVGTPKPAWELLWHEARQKKGPLVNIPQQDVNGDIMVERGFFSLSGQAMAQKFGVGIAHSKLQTITQEYDDGQTQHAEVLLLELAKYLLIKMILDVGSDNQPSVHQSGEYGIAFPENVGLRWSLPMWNNIFTRANGLGNTGGGTIDRSGGQDCTRSNDRNDSGGNELPSSKISGCGTDDGIGGQNNR